MSFQCQEMSDGSLAISGELDIAHAQDAKAAMCDVLSRPVATVDLSGVTEIDFIGVQVLLAAQQEAQVDNRPLALANGSAVVSEALGLLGLAMPVNQSEGNKNESR